MKCKTCGNEIHLVPDKFRQGFELGITGRDIEYKRWSHATTAIWFESYQGTSLARWCYRAEPTESDQIQQLLKEYDL